MGIWKLEPMDPAPEYWARSPWYKGRVIVRAPDEREARRMAMLKLNQYLDVLSSYQSVHLPPWEDPGLVRCTRIYDSGFDENGSTMVLEPSEDE